VFITASMDGSPTSACSLSITWKQRAVMALHMALTSTIKVSSGCRNSLLALLGRDHESGRAGGAGHGIGFSCRAGVHVLDLEDAHPDKGSNVCRAMIMNVNQPGTRGVALALHVVLADLGKGVGPALVAVLIIEVTHLPLQLILHAQSWGSRMRRAMIMNVNEPETRGVALALHVVLDDLGKGVGPALVAVLITALGRQLAFSLSIAGWIPCGMLIREQCFVVVPPPGGLQPLHCQSDPLRHAEL